MILVITNRGDLTADWLILELAKRELDFLRFNTEEFPQKVCLAWSGDGSATFKAETWSFDASSVSAAWYRRPSSPSLEEHSRVDPQWVAGEALEALRGIWKTLDCLWVNHPDLNARAENKISQLSRASSVGFAVPETLVTNDVTLAREFVDSHRGVVCKPLHDGRPVIDGEERIFFTSRIKNQIGEMGPAPCIFQEEVRKRFDVRVTVIGSEAYGVKIQSQSVNEGRTDWRRANPIPPHELFELPDEVAEDCLRLSKSFGLQFAAIDLAVDTRGEFIFFEVNPNGQWVWLEQLTGLPLRSRMADLLSHKSPE